MPHFYKELARLAVGPESDGRPQVSPFSRAELERSLLEGSTRNRGRQPGRLITRMGQDKYLAADLKNGLELSPGIGCLRLGVIRDTTGLYLQ